MASRPHALFTLVLAATILALFAGSTAAQPLPGATRFYLSPAPQRANVQIAELKAEGRTGAARKLRAMVRTPHVVWLVGATRNGRGPWAGTAAHSANEPGTEAWCNPPGRGAGKRPTADTSVALVDAYLWIEAPGESDGRCYRWTDGPNDPAREMSDPASGLWFPQMGLKLAKNAKPAFP